MGANKHNSKDSWAIFGARKRHLKGETNRKEACAKPKPIPQFELKKTDNNSFKKAKFSPF